MGCCIPQHPIVTLDHLTAELSGIPEDFWGKLPEIPMDTRILTTPLYRQVPAAEITCVDYSPAIPVRANRWYKGLSHVLFLQGNVGNLPSKDSRKQPSELFGRNLWCCKAQHSAEHFLFYLSSKGGFIIIYTNNRNGPLILSATL